MNTQEEKTTALTLSKNPMRLRPYPLKRCQAALGAAVKSDSGSTLSESLCWTCVGKTRLSALLAFRTRPGARVSSSSSFDGFSDGGRVAMGGRSCLNNVPTDAEVGAAF